jgi:hypothetical protein
VKPEQLAARPERREKRPLEVRLARSKVKLAMSKLVPLKQLQERLGRGLRV